MRAKATDPVACKARELGKLREFGTSGPLVKVHGGSDLSEEYLVSYAGKVDNCLLQPVLGPVGERSIASVLTGACRRPGRGLIQYECNFALLPLLRCLDSLQEHSGTKRL